MLRQPLNQRLGVWLGLALFVSAGGAALAEPVDATARGVVFHDRNGNGRRDPGEPGIRGVGVSDGRRIVSTDGRGRYELDIADEAVLFVIKPRGWMTPVSPEQLPRFYYIHQPAGSPSNLRYPGVEPTGPLPASIDFALRPQREPKRFEAILLADPQPQSHAEVDALRDDIVDELLGTKARFGMTLGDIMFDDLSLLPRWNALLGQVGIPWYNVPGNHELNFEAADDRHSLETFKRYFGPPYYAFDYADVHVVVLDNIEYQGAIHGESGSRVKSGGYKARFGATQLAWLKQDLARVPKKRLVLLTMHAPLRAYPSSAEQHHDDIEDLRELLALLSGRPHLYAVAGHTHTTEHHYLGPDAGFSGPGRLHHHILTTASGSWWSGPLDARGVPHAEQRDGTPNGYHILEVDGPHLTVRYKAANAPASRQMRIAFDVVHHGDRDYVQRDFRPFELLNGHFTYAEAAGALVLVNLFDGGPQSQVSMRLDDGDWIAMERRPMRDPHAHELFQRHPQSVKPWVEATWSSHMFRARLPAALTPGVHTLTVRARDEFGRLHHGRRIIEVGAPMSVARSRGPSPPDGR